MKSVLDASVLLGPPPGPLEGDVAISSISLADVHFAVLSATSADVRAERLRRLGVIERTFDALPVDDTVARHYGRLAAGAAVGGHPETSAADLLIAATAAAHGARVCTRNASAYASVSHMVAIIAVGE